MELHPALKALIALLGVGALVGIVIGVLYAVGVLPHSSSYANLNTFDSPAAYETAYAYRPTADDFENLSAASAPAGEPLSAQAPLESSGMALPMSSAQTVPFDPDVANTNIHAFQVNAPRVNMGLSKLAKLADPIRGDIPVTVHPDIPLIGKSIYGRDSLRLDGTFSDYGRQLYHNLQAGASQAYKNINSQLTSTGELIMDA